MHARALSREGCGRNGHLHVSLGVSEPGQGQGRDLKLRHQAPPEGCYGAGLGVGLGARA